MKILVSFAALAAVSGVLLLASVASGLRSGGGGGAGPAWLAGATLGATLGAHLVASLGLGRWARRSRSLARAGTGWPRTQAARNLSRVRPFAAGGSAGSAAAAGLAVGAGGSAAALAAASAALAFNLGAFLLEWASLRAQRRLLGDAEGRPAAGGPTSAGGAR